MDTKYVKPIVFAAGLCILILIGWYARNVFFLAFASILLAIFLRAVGKGAMRITGLPYSIALWIAILCMLGILTLTFWLYSPLIVDQGRVLFEELPQAASSVVQKVTPYLGSDFLADSKFLQEFSLTNQKVISQIFSIFSSTLGSIVGFLVFLIVGLYLAFDPQKYLQWIISLLPKRTQEPTRQRLEHTGQSLRWWILGKLLSMTVVGLCTFIGLSLLHVNLAFILGILAGLLTFVPYVGAILSSIPAILIGFAHSPLTALYVSLLYLVIHLLDGYLITPNIEQRTASIPPALSIMMQMLLSLLIGALGLALATPLTVVLVSFLQSTSKRLPKIPKQAHQANQD